MVNSTEIGLFILSLGMFVFIILYFTGLGFATTAMFNVSPCGCTETTASGVSPLIVSSGANAAVLELGTPLVTVITPKDDDKKKLNISSIELGISKMSIIVTWLIMLAMIIFGIFFTLNYLIIAIVVVAIPYLAALGILSTQIFTLGSCGCNITIDAQSGTAQYSASPVTPPILTGTPATVVTIPEGSTYSLDKDYAKDSMIGFSKFGLIFTWIIYLIILIGLIINKFG
jgi:hypothetical protein